MGRGSSKPESNTKSFSPLPAFSGLCLFFLVDNSVAIFLQGEICMFGVIFMGTCFSDESLKCHYFAEAITTLLNDSVKIYFRSPAAFSNKFQQ